jgi:hypothetical protein
MYLKTPDERYIRFSEDMTDYDKATFIMGLLVKYDTVELRSDNYSGDMTRWTVLERDQKGIPVQVACEEFDGAAEVIFCGGSNE